MKTRFLALLFCPLLLASAARAQVLFHSISISPVLSLPTSTTRPLQLPGFDASLGTLTGVSFGFTGYTERSALGENLGASGATYSYNLSSTLTLSLAGGPALFTFAPAALAGSGSLGGFDGGFDFAGASGFNTSTITTPVTGTYDVAADLVAGYASLVPVDFTAVLAGSSALSSSGSASLQSTNRAGGTLGVTYSYTPIPEPSTYAAAAGLAVLGAAALRRRRAVA